eukprot:1500402-Rhodomonas_salina.2
MSDFPGLETQGSQIQKLLEMHFGEHLVNGRDSEAPLELDAMPVGNNLPRLPRHGVTDVNCQLVRIRCSLSRAVRAPDCKDATLRLVFRSCARACRLQVDSEGCSVLVLALALAKGADQAGEPRQEGASGEVTRNSLPILVMSLLSVPLSDRPQTRVPIGIPARAEILPYFCTTVNLYHSTAAVHLRFSEGLDVTWILHQRNLQSRTRITNRREAAKQ